jgi:hypothetical protein
VDALSFATGARLGRYEIVRALDTDELGTRVLARARDRHEAGSEVVLLVLAEPISDDPARVARVLGRARRAAELAHPNLVSVLDVGRYGERVFVVSEHVAQGRSLPDLITGLQRRGRSLSLGEGLSIAVDLCAVWQHLRERSGPEPGRLLDAADLDARDVLLAASGVRLCDPGLRTAAGPYTPETLPSDGAVGDLKALGRILMELPLSHPIVTDLLDAARAGDVGGLNDARGLQAALEQVARQEGVSLSPAALAASLTSLFEADAGAVLARAPEPPTALPGPSARRARKPRLLWLVIVGLLGAPGSLTAWLASRRAGSFALTRSTYEAFDQALAARGRYRGLALVLGAAAVACLAYSVHTWLRTRKRGAQPDGRKRGPAIS